MSYWRIHKIKLRPYEDECLQVLIRPPHRISFL